MLNRTSVYVILSILILILLSIIEPSIKMGVLFAIIITAFKYIDTFLHELGHFIVGRLVGYEIEKVVIGDRRQIFSVKVFSTSFVFCYGFGGLTVIGSSINESKLSLSAFVLGGAAFQALVICIVYISFGIGSEENYFLPLLFMAFNFMTIIFNLYPRIITRDGESHPSDGLLLLKIVKAEK